MRLPRQLDALEDMLQNTARSMVVAGDFNGRALEWGTSHLHTRGILVLGMTAGTRLLVLNVGNVTTFRRPG